MNKEHSEIIDRLGGTCATARLFKVTSQAVSKWRNEGIPSYRIDYLELLRPDVIRRVEQKNK